MREFTDAELRLLTELLPNVGGEMRAAMTNMYIAAGRMTPMEKRERDEKLDKNVAAFLQSYHRMNRLVHNLTGAAELVSDSPYLMKNTDVVGLTRELVEQAEALFELEGVTLRFESDKPGCVILLEEERFTRMLLNLLSNALKFTPAGGSVTVRARVTPQWVRLSVSDTGRGIPPEKLESVFERFLDTESLDPAPHGLGLGLALCRRVAQGHGGSIVAESEEGKGARFTVSLPNRRTDNYRMEDSGQTDPAGGFNRMLTELSDALSVKAFGWRYTD